MADALASGVSDRKVIGVRLPSPAPYQSSLINIAPLDFIGYIDSNLLASHFMGPRQIGTFDEQQIFLSRD